MPFSGSDYCMTTKELLRTLKGKKLDYPGLLVEKIERFSKLISDYMKLVIDDVINNAVVHKLSHSKETYIKMESVTGDDFRKARERGAHQDIDPYKSDCTGHSLAFVTKGTKKYRKKYFILDHRLKSIITEKTNNGFKY